MFARTRRGSDWTYKRGGCFLASQLQRLYFIFFFSTETTVLHLPPPEVGSLRRIAWMSSMGHAGLPTSICYGLTQRAPVEGGGGAVTWGCSEPGCTPEICSRASWCLSLFRLSTPPCNGFVRSAAASTAMRGSRSPCSGTRTPGRGKGGH